MKNIRIIPRLDIKGPNIVKGVRTEGLRVVGQPKAMAKKYYDAGADELIAMDIVASLYGRSPDFDLLRGVADELFIPLTVGGGVQSIHDIGNLLQAGADKVAINTGAVKNPALLGEAVHRFGAQCIMLSVEANRHGPGQYEAYTDGGREHSGKDAIAWIKQAIDQGVGEILLTAVDRDGTRSGFDLELLKIVTDFATIPVVLHGGARDAKSLGEALTGKADAVAIASILHYDDTTVGALKEELIKDGFPIRRSA